MTANGRRRSALALGIASVLLVTGMAILPPAACAGTAVVFIEDFESGAIGSRWTSADNNTASGLDYWGISSYRTHAGNYSAWSAQVGNQSGSGLNNTDVHQYDNDMQADLTINLAVSGFTSLTLSFWYWSRAEAGGGDYLEAWYVAGGLPTMIFQNRGTATWSTVSLPVPNNVEKLVIRFTTDAANNNFEGAYVDDVVMTGTENNPPTSSALSLPTYVSTMTVDVAFTAADGVNESGVNFVELWYRPGTTGNFTLYTRPANPAGEWTVSPARFDVTYAAGDGYYEFYTIAVDNASNREAPPGVPDASTTVDTVAPGLAISSPIVDATLTTSTVTVTWNASDATSGIDHFEVWLDAGARQSTTGLEHTFTNVSAGDHTLHVVAVDRAGNSREQTVTFTVTPPPSAFPWWIILLILAILFILFLILLWRRRSEQEELPPREPKEESEEPAGTTDAPEPPEPDSEDIEL